MQAIVPSYCRAGQALEASCSASLPCLRFPSFKNSSLRSRRFLLLKQQEGFSRFNVRTESNPQRRRHVVEAVATPDSAVGLPLTAENVETVLDEVRPYLMSDGGNVALHEIDGNVVKLKLQGACGSCPSSTMTMKMGIERRLMEMIPEIVAVEPVTDEEAGLELNEENIEKLKQSDRLQKYNWGTHFRYLRK